MEERQTGVVRVRLPVGPAGQGLCHRFFFNDTATTEIYTLSLHDALPIWARGLPVLAPGVQRGQGEAAPPGLVLEAHSPPRVALRQADQPVAAPFFPAHSGSGEVIQRLARSQRIPIRSRVARTVSALTLSAVTPPRSSPPRPKRASTGSCPCRTPWGSDGASRAKPRYRPRRRRRGPSRVGKSACAAPLRCPPR